ncbi:hypothetical protein [Streptomyces sp. NPDC006879]|uniref:hypothetical protein n=1 Tax=Streptomyces sp. NPDC006879 TaxID=3364767 RepID=UPI0036BC2CF7
MHDAPERVDFLHGQPEELPLSQAASSADVHRLPVRHGQGCTHRECQLLDAVRLGPDDDVAEVTAAQVRRVITHLIRQGPGEVGDPDVLVPLGGGGMATGAPLPAGGLPWHGPRAAAFDLAALTESLAATPRLGAEGFVLLFPGRDNTMSKIK